MAISLLASLAPAQATGEAPSVKELIALDVERLLDVVVTATKAPRRVDEAPSTVAVVTRQQIRQAGFRTVGEALKAVPGLAQIDDLVSFNLGVRGFYAGPDAASSTVKLLLNGQPVAYRPTQANAFGHELIPIEAVKRIEVIRGPGSALYGANAFLGVINVITRDASELKPGQHVRHSVAVDGSYLQNANAQTANGTVSLLSFGRWRGLRYLITGTFTRTDRSGLVLPGIADVVLDGLHAGERDRHAPPRGYPTPAFSASARRTYAQRPISRGDIERAGSAYASVSWRGGLGELTLDGHLQYADRFGEFQSYSVLTHENRVTWFNTFGRLSYTLGGEEGWRLRAAAAISAGNPTDDEHLVDGFTPSLYKQRDQGNVGLDLSAELRYGFAGRRGSLALGFDYTRDRQNLTTLREFDSATGQSGLGDRFGRLTFSSVGAYLQGSWQPLTGLGLTFGLRTDHNSQIPCNSNEWDCLGRRDDTTGDSPWDPDGRLILGDRGALQLSSRAAAVYNLQRIKSYAKLIYGSSFRPPAAYQLYHTPLGVTATEAGDPTLRPQTADTLELALGTHALKNLHATLTGFFMTVNNMAVLLKEEVSIRNRNTDVTTAGLELSVRYRPLPILSGLLHLTLLPYSRVQPKKRASESNLEWRVSTLNTEVPVGMFPEVSAYLALNLLTFKGRLNCHAGARVVGPRRASLINNQLYNALDLDQTYELDPYVDIDLTFSTVGLRLVGRQETVLSLSLRGIPGGYQEPGFGGIDVPALGPRIFLRAEQVF